MTITTILVLVIALFWNAAVIRKNRRLQRELDEAKILHFNRVHFTGVTIDGMMFVYCPVGNIISWSEGDYRNKWCHFEHKYFSEVES